MYNFHCRNNCEIWEKLSLVNINCQTTTVYLHFSSLQSSINLIGLTVYTLAGLEMLKVLSKPSTLIFDILNTGSIVESTLYTKIEGQQKARTQTA